MRLQALVLPALLLALACKSDPGDESAESTGANCTVAAVGDLDPNYPPCDCDYKCEDTGAECRFTAISSICKAECVDDSDCPPLAGLAATCNGGHCTIYCGDAMPCPTGYVCIENISCQAER